MADSLTQHEAPLRLSNESGSQCTLFLSMSRVPESGDERQYETLDSQIPEAEPDRPRFSHGDPTVSQWDAALRQSYRLFKVFDQFSVQVLRNQLCFGSHAMFRYDSSISSGYNGTYIEHLRSQAVS